MISKTALDKFLGGSFGKAISKEALECMEEIRLEQKVSVLDTTLYFDHGAKLGEARIKIIVELEEVEETTVLSRDEK